MADPGNSNDESSDLRPAAPHLHPIRGYRFEADERGRVTPHGEAGTPTPAPKVLAASGAMNFYGGPVLTHPSVRVLYSGIQWKNSTFVADKIAGIDAFFKGYAGSSYAKSADEYIGSNGEVTAALTYQGHDATPQSASLDGTNLNSVVAAACSEVTNGRFPLDTSGNQIIILFSDKKRPSNINYCGYHGATSCLQQRVQYAFLWNADGDPGCNAQDTTTGHSQGLAALINITAHEVHEMRTDPTLRSWFDSQGNEVGDKCAWTFASKPAALSNGTHWKVQNEWSNAAYMAGTGSINLSDQKGCVNSGS
jgi:hypothetical protein